MTIIRIASYNIHSGVGTDEIQDYRRIGEFLKRENIDVALMQEVDTRSIERDTETDINNLRTDHFAHLISSPALVTENGWYGNAILSRFDVKAKRTIDVSYGGFQPRNIQEAILATPGGDLRVINTHQGLKRVERRQQFTMLGEHIVDGNKDVDQSIHQMPLIVGGDFNEWQLFSRSLKIIDDILTQHKVGATFPTRWPLFRLDRIWSYPSNLVKTIKILKTKETKYYSDHYPILLEIEV